MTDDNANKNSEKPEKLEGKGSSRKHDLQIGNAGEQKDALEAAHAGDSTLSKSGLSVPLILYEESESGTAKVLASSRPLQSEAAPDSQAQLRALANEHEALEPVLQLDKYARSLPEGDENRAKYRQLVKEQTREVLQANQGSTASNIYTGGTLPAIGGGGTADGDNRPIYSSGHNKTGEKSFDVGLVYDERPQPANQDDLQIKLGRFFEAAARRASDSLTNPEARANYLQAQTEKFIGIGEGLNEAKEALKTAAHKGWTALNDGTVIEILARPIEINIDLVEATAKILDELARDPNAVNKALSKGFDITGEKILEASDRYSHLSDREKGKIIGMAMFGFVNPEGSLEVPMLLEQSAVRSGHAVQTIVEAAASSASAQELRASIQLLKEFGESDELQEVIGQMSRELFGTGPRPAYAFATTGGGAIHPDDLNNAMAWSGKDWLDAMKKWLRKPQDEAPLPEIKTKPETKIKGYSTGNNERVSLSDRLKKYNGKPDDALLEEFADTDPLDTKLPRELAARLAVERMVEKVPEGNPAFEHYLKCKDVLNKNIPPGDLLFLYERGHKFHFPDSLASARPGLTGKGAEIPFRPDVNYEELPGLSKPLEQFSIVPKMMRDSESGRWVETSSMVNNLEGVVRHETGHVMSEFLGWKGAGRVINRYYMDRVRVEAFKTGLENELKDVSQHFGQNSVEALNRTKQLKRLDQLTYHVLGDDYGIDQTLADLYAIDCGGSAWGAEFDKLLLEHFDSLDNHMKKNKWFRQWE